MPKIYVAQPSAIAGSDTVEGDFSKVLASGSMTTIKERLRAFPDTQWSIKTIQLKADMPTICSLIEDWSKVAVAEATESVRVNASGQVRAVK